MNKSSKKLVSKISHASIRDVAECAGVSLSSVSRVLNGSSYVSADLKLRVNEAISKLKFRPNAHARGLRASNSMTIGLILRDVANNTFATLWKAAMDAAERYGYRVLVMTSETSRTKEAECIQLMLQQQVDGIVGFVADESRNSFKSLAKRVPLVLVESKVRGINVDRVFCGNREGSKEATDFLLNHGHKRIVFLSGAQSRIPGRERKIGFQEAFDGRGLRIDESLIFSNSHLSQDDRMRLRSLLLNKNPPSAMFAATAHLTLEGLAIARELNISIPDQLSFVGFDNHDLASLNTPPLATVERDVYRLGVAAVELLVSRIKESSALCRTITIPTTLIPRASVKYFSNGRKAA